MRPARDLPDGYAATPIFDALCAEYRRTFRTLPGDRSGEEELAFRAFGTTRSTGLHRLHGAPPARWPVPARQLPPQAALPPAPRGNP